MDPALAAIIFVATIFFIIIGVIDRAIVAVFGAVLMILFGVVSEVEAFYLVDWNIIGILFGIWIIATYFNKTGIPEALAKKLAEFSGHKIPFFISLLGLLSGFLSTLLDNVIVVLMTASIMVPLLKRVKIRVTPFIIFTALCANFMGSALLLGDLPPQMLHSVTGIEFLEFIWQDGRPSSFPILTLTFLVTVLAFYFFKFRKFSLVAKEEMLKAMNAHSTEIGSKAFALVVVLIFSGTVIAMALRQFIGMALGFIALTGAAILMISVEILRKKELAPRFDEILSNIDWKAILFYISLFILVGSIDKAGIIMMMSKQLQPLMSEPLTGATVLYWATVSIVGVVEHDAYILTFLYVIRNVASVLNPWPYYWILLWAGTLGSNLTMVGAPALYVALNICEKEDKAKVSLKEFFSYTVPFVTISAFVNYLLAIAIWVLPEVI